MPIDTLAENVARLTERVETLSESVKELRSDVSQMKQMADRYKGAFLFIVGVGGAMGWLISLWDKLGFKHG